MSEIVLSTTPNHYDYSMVNINPELVNKNSNDNDSTIENNTQHPPYNSYPGKIHKFFFLIYSGRFYWWSGQNKGDFYTYYTTIDRCC